MDSQMIDRQTDWRVNKENKKRQKDVNRDAQMQMYKPITKRIDVRLFLPVYIYVCDEHFIKFCLHKLIINQPHSAKLTKRSELIRRDLAIRPINASRFCSGITVKITATHASREFYSQILFATFLSLAGFPTVKIRQQLLLFGALLVWNPKGIYVVGI